MLIKTRYHKVHLIQEGFGGGEGLLHQSVVSLDAFVDVL